MKKKDKRSFLGSWINESAILHAHEDHNLSGNLTFLFSIKGHPLKGKSCTCESMHLFIRFPWNSYKLKKIQASQTKGHTTFKEIIVTFESQLINKRINEVKYHTINVLRLCNHARIRRPHQPIDETASSREGFASSDLESTKAMRGLRENLKIVQFISN